MGYSGKDFGKNNPSMERVPYVGPIPHGLYRIGRAVGEAAKGPLTMRLTAIGHTTFGRTAFLIHGDSIKHPGDASKGCIVLDFGTGSRIARSPDKELEVVK